MGERKRGANAGEGDDMTKAAPDMILEVRRRLNSRADQIMNWSRQNLRYALEHHGLTANDIATMTGVSTNTVLGFLEDRDSSARTAVLICLATGYRWYELAQPPTEFRKIVSERLKEG